MRDLYITPDEFKKMKIISNELHQSGIIIPEHEQSAIALDIVINKVPDKKIIKKWKSTLSN